MPKVSVIVPFYNVEPYIERCARSLFSQTLCDMEFIFVDDCSTDNSIMVLNSILTYYPERRAQTKLIHLDKNVGQAIAFREGLKHVSGEYLIKCDGDDEVELSTYEQMYFKARTEDLDLVMCDFVQLYPDGSDVYIGQHLTDDNIEELLAGRLSTSVCNKLVNVKVFDANFIYPTKCMCEDFVYSIQFFYRCSKTGVINQPFYKYYRYSTSFLSVPDEERRLQIFYQLIENIGIVADIVDRNGDGAKYKDLIILKKLVAKNYLLKYLGKNRIYKLWKGTFGEINRKVISCHSVPFRLKIFYVMSQLRIYPIYLWYKSLK